MKMRFKIILTLLIAVVMTGVFAVLAYTSLFSQVEKQFYNQRILDNNFKELDRAAFVYNHYLELKRVQFLELLGSNSIKTVFNPNQTNEDIENRERMVSGLANDVPGFQYLRIVDLDGQKIHYSSLSSDVQLRDNRRIIYKNWMVSEDFSKESPLLGDNPAGSISLDDKGKRFVFAIPVKDNFDLVRGTALVYMSWSNIQDYFFKQGLVSASSRLSLSRKGLILNLTEDELKRVKPDETDPWTGINENNINPLPFGLKDGNEVYYLVWQRTGEFNTGILIPASEMRFSWFTRLFFILIFFISIYLLVFLFLNIRQDRMTVVTERIKEFQIRFLNDYLNSKESLDWAVWEKEIALRKNEVRSEILRGIGRLKPEENLKIENLVDSSWDEIIAVITKNKKEEKASSLDLEQLEAVIRRSLSSLQIPVTIQAREAVPVGRKRDFADTGDIEEIGSTEDYEDLEEAEAVDEAEDLEEAEAVDEAEDLEEAEAVDEAEDLEEAEAVDDLLGIDDSPSIDEPFDFEKESIPHKNAVHDEERDDSLPLDTEELEELSLDEREDIPLHRTMESEDEQVTDALCIDDFSTEDNYKPAFEVMTGDPMDQDDVEEIEAIEDSDDIAEMEELEEILPVEDLTEAEDLSGDSASGGLKILPFDTFMVQIRDELHKLIRENEQLYSSGGSTGEERYYMEELVSVHTARLFEDFNELVLKNIISEPEDQFFHLTRFGFNFDDYTTRFKPGEVGIYKALMKLTRKYNALSGSILKWDHSNIKVIYTIGLNESSCRVLPQFSEIPGITAGMTEKAGMIIPDIQAWHLARLPVVHVKDFMKNRAFLFLPVQFSNESCHLLLGFEELKKDPVKLLTNQ
jgi:hypothetical protein